jgi:CRISPR-associated protein Cas2
MYVIAMYDIGEKRVAKMLKLCRRYLNWIQNSVFEGEISEAQLSSLKYEAEDLMEEDDSLIFFKSRDQKWLDKEIIGEERSSVDNIL